MKNKQRIIQIIKELLGMARYRESAQYFIDTVEEVEKLFPVPCCGHDCCCNHVKSEQKKLLKGFEK